MKGTPYDAFVASEEIPVYEAFAISDLPTVALGPWRRTGGNGCYVHLEGRGPSNAFVTEIPPGGELLAQRHLFEESVFVVTGSGRTELWNDSGFRAAFNWDASSVFAVPLNVHYRHVNRSNTEACRLFSITNEPMMINLLYDPSVIFNCDLEFADRFNATRTNYTKPAVAPDGTFVGDLVPSATDIPLVPHPTRGADGTHMNLDLASSSLGSHISEFPPGRYKKAHRHGPGAHVIILTGSGYSLLWKGSDDPWDRGGEPVRVDWQPGCVVVPPDRWFHQHFNTGAEPARYLALRFGTKVIYQDNDESRGTPTRDGGDQIEYEDEYPRIRKLFEGELTR